MDRSDPRMRLAQEVNSRVPDLLRAALDHSRTIVGSEANTEANTEANRNFAAKYAEIIQAVDGNQPGLNAQGITFAVARLAAQIIDQVSVEAGMDPEKVILEFSR
ncbi:hypothetical protein [Microbacterium sp. TPD7012]|uniref:hypothetical protein n=1 Tax=Microbacterium sp. TPD7012 TaxID=2171975 RepID=UPI000D51A969|nr:hypothetical protein [Microbacterium sp. TPD7012]PVE94979.1 hypothetical protein DC434_13725 [Microbacterium sp. TPD7012]